MPDECHRNEPSLRNSLWMGRHKAVLDAMAKSTRPSSNIFSLNSAHCLICKGYPVSVKFRSIDVMTMMASPIQNKTKKPRKS